jgi:hypothetical protein
MSYLEPLIGRQCTRLTFDAFDPPLVLWFLYEGPAARIEISGRLKLEVDGAAFDVDPEGALDSSGVLLRLIGQRVTAAEVQEGESLYLELSGGARLTVPGDSNPEPWFFHVEDDLGVE